MNERGWEELSIQFATASELPEVEREEFLGRLEVEDPVLAREVRRMLASEAVTNDFLVPPSKQEFEEPLRMLSFDFRGMKLGEFELIREIGRGGSGVVYAGQQPSLDRKVAIKILAPHLVGSEDARARFEREAKAASNLRHPAIVSVLSYGEQQGAVYLVLEYVEGRTLHQHLEGLRLACKGGEHSAPQEPDVSQPQVAAGIALRLAEGLEHCHGQGVLHRDIKPQNILLEQDLSPRIVDFGLAKNLKHEGITDAGLISGTLHYMSPEQAQARSNELDARTDIYSLGVVLYEMLTLRRPFEGTPDSQLVAKVLHARPPPPHHLRPELPRSLSAICLRALEKSPGDRYERASELAQDLRAYLRGARIALSTRLQFEDAYRYVFIKRPWIAVTGLVVILGLALAISPKAFTSSNGAGVLAHSTGSSAMPESTRRALQRLIDKASTPEERTLMEAQLKVIESNFTSIEAKTTHKEDGH